MSRADSKGSAISATNGAAGCSDDLGSVLIDNLEPLGVVRAALWAFHADRLPGLCSGAALGKGRLKVTADLLDRVLVQR